MLATDVKSWKFYFVAGAQDVKDDFDMTGLTPGKICPDFGEWPPTQADIVLSFPIIRCSLSISRISSDTLFI